MLSFFKRLGKGGNSSPKGPSLVDLDNHPLTEGDRVISLRYELGECILVSAEKGFEYESLSSGKRVSWLKMIDASTERQKVRKILAGSNGRSELAESD